MVGSVEKLSNPKFSTDGLHLQIRDLHLHVHAGDVWKQLPVWWIFSDHPRKLTWNLEIPPWKRRNVYKPPILGFHDNFRGCISVVKFQMFHPSMSGSFSTPYIGDGPNVKNKEPLWCRNPYYWVYDPPLLHGNTGSLDPNTSEIPRCLMKIKVNQN